MRRLPVVECLVAVLDGRKDGSDQVGDEEDVECLDRLDGVRAGAPVERNTALVDGSSNPGSCLHETGLDPVLLLFVYLLLLRVPSGGMVKFRRWRLSRLWFRRHSCNVLTWMLMVQGR